MQNRLAYLIIGVLAVAPHLQAAHIDITPYFVGRSNPTNFSLAPTALKTGSSNFDAPVLDPNDRVFTGTANNYATGPGWVSTIDPGWSIPSSASAYPTGTSRARTNTSSSNLSYNVVVDPKLGRNFSYWDGTGTPTFGQVPNGEVLQIRLSSGTVTLDGSATAMPGTVVKSNVSTSTAVHVHWQQRLYGDATLELGDLPTEGFYLFSVNAQINGYGTTYVSDPLYVIMAHGFDKYFYVDGVEMLTPEFQSARNWVNTQVLPEPSSLTLVGVLGTMLLRRRKADKDHGARWLSGGLK
jgi:hypothetical protein